MNEMDLLSRLRDEVPLGVSPRAEHLFRTALFETDDPSRATLPGRDRSSRRGARAAWRPVLAVSLAAAVAAAVVVTALPSHGQAPAVHRVASGPPARGQVSAPRPASPVELLADRAAAAALAGPDVKPGQWVYRLTESRGQLGKSVKTDTEEVWSKADDSVEANYYDGKLKLYDRDRDYNGVQGVPDLGSEPLSYSSLGSLPAQPGALLARLAKSGADVRPAGCTLSSASCTDFGVISNLLSGYLMPPAITAAMYRALGDIPGIAVVPSVDVAGQTCTGFRIPLQGGGHAEMVINSSTYQYVATFGSFSGGAVGRIVVVHQALVSGPGVRP
jgi:hypothetical protein